MLSRVYLCVALIFSQVLPAAAADYPQRAVRIVVTVQAGGTADATARYLAKQLYAQLQQPYIVENKPGISGIVAVEYVSNSNPDGYTLLYAADVLAIAPAAIPNLSVNVEHDLTPITLVGVAPFVFVVNPRIPAKTPSELVAYIKLHPGGFRWGIGGVGTAGQLAIARFSQIAGIHALEVPYKGNAPATMATLSGEVDGTVALYTTVKSLVDAGQLRVLGVASAQPVPGMPGVPTIASFGYPGYQAISWFGIWGPRGMPPQLVQQIHDQVQTALATPALQQEFARAGFQVSVSKDPTTFASFFKEKLVEDKAIVQKLPPQ